MTTMYSPNSGDRPPQIRTEAVGEAWELVRANMGTWILIMLVYLVVVFGIGYGIGAVLGLLGLQPKPNPGNPTAGLPGMIMGNLLSGIISTVFTAFFQGGLYRAALKQVRGETPSVGDLFSCGDVLGSLVVGILLYQLAVDLGLFLCLIPAFFVIGALMFTIPLIVDKGMGGVDALKLSWDTLKSQAWSACGVLILAGLTNFLGMLACGVGILVTMPIQFLTVAILYRDFFGTPGGGMFSPQIEMPLPPATPASSTMRSLDM